MKRFSFIAAMFVTGAVAISQDAPKPDDLFKQLDKNNDGKLVRSEIPEDQIRHFERLLRVGDDDKNGELSKAEFDKATSDKQDEPRRPEGGPGAGPGGRPGFGGGIPDAKEAFERMDQNKDGKLSRNELPEFARDRLGRIFDDLKKDEITLEEFQKGREKLGPPEGGRPGAGQFGSPDEMFKRLDTNGDGKLTLEEVPDRARQFMAPMFERLGKKELTKDEFVQAAERFRAQGGGDGARRPEGAPGREGERRPEAAGRDGERRPEGAPRDGQRPPEGAPRDGGPRPEAGRGDGPPRMIPRVMQLLDKDRNGRLSKDELAQISTVFAELDENKDGELDPRELMGPPPQGAGGPEGMRRPEGGNPPPRGEGNRPPEGAGRGDAPRRPEGDRPTRPEGDRPADGQRRPGADQPREGGQRNATDAEFFKRMDANNDGKISKEEAPERLKENFDRVDANKDGFVSADELRAFFERARRPQN